MYNVITGFAFGVPMPVQPMKTIAAVALSQAPLTIPQARVWLQRCCRLWWLLRGAVGVVVVVVLAAVVVSCSCSRAAVAHGQEGGACREGCASPQGVEPTRLLPSPGPLTPAPAPAPAPLLQIMAAGIFVSACVMAMGALRAFWLASR